MFERNYDFAVIGLGAVGSAALMHLAKESASVCGVDQFSPPHNLGSSHGETRITRQSIGEGDSYVPLVLRSHELWRKIEKDAACEIFTVCGGLIIDGSKGSQMHGVAGFAKRTIEYAERFGIDHEVLTAKEAMRRFPGFQIEKEDLVYFEPGAGFLRPEIAVQAQLRLAERHGAKLCLNEKVEAVGRDPSGTVTIRTSTGEIHAGQCLLAAGSWIKNFVPESCKPLFKISRQVLHWLPIRNGSYPLPGCPIFIWCYGVTEEDEIYGFPSLDGQTIKVATESALESISPESIDRTVAGAEQETFFRKHITGRLTDVTGPPENSVTCQYTVTPESKFIVERHPEIPELLVASCCSGHGFKHSAALGESIAGLLHSGRSKIDLSPFRGELAKAAHLRQMK